MPEAARGRALLVTRKPGTIAGLPLVELTFRRLSPRSRITASARDGQAVKAGTTLMTIKGSARAMLSGERVALNVLGRLSGVATATARIVRRVGNTKVRIICTRKTTPACARSRNTRSAAAAASTTASASMTRS